MDNDYNQPHERSSTPHSEGFHNADNSTPEFRPKEPTQSPIGTVIGVLAVLALFILSGLYLYGKKLDSNSIDDGEMTEEETSDAVRTEIDEFSSIESELEKMDDFDTLGAELEDELDAEFSK